MTTQIIQRAIEIGLVSKSEACLMGPDQLKIIQFFLYAMGSEEICENSVSLEEVCLMNQEISELNDLLDLGECDKVEPNKTFSPSEGKICIPVSLVPFMRGVVLPALREIVEKSLD